MYLIFVCSAVLVIALELAAQARIPPAQTHVLCILIARLSNNFVGCEEIWLAHRH